MKLFENWSPGCSVLHWWRKLLVCCCLEESSYLMSCFQAVLPSSCLTAAASVFCTMTVCLTLSMLELFLTHFLAVIFLVFHNMAVWTYYQGSCQVLKMLWFIWDLQGLENPWKQTRSLTVSKTVLKIPWNCWNLVLYLDTTVSISVW